MIMMAESPRPRVRLCPCGFSCSDEEQMRKHKQRLHKDPEWTGDFKMMPNLSRHYDGEKIPVKKGENFGGLWCNKCGVAHVYTCPAGNTEAIRIPIDLPWTGDYKTE